MKYVFLFLALVLGVARAVKPTYAETRATSWEEQAKLCLPPDLYALVTTAVATVGRGGGEPVVPLGVTEPINEMARFTDLLATQIRSGRSFCKAYAITCARCVVEFSNSLTRPAQESSYLSYCEGELRASSDSYVQGLVSAKRTGSEDALSRCFHASKLIIRQNLYGE